MDAAKKALLLQHGFVVPPFGGQSRSQLSSLLLLLFLPLLRGAKRPTKGKGKGGVSSITFPSGEEQNSTLGKENEKVFFPSIFLKKAKLLFVTFYLVKLCVKPFPVRSFPAEYKKRGRTSLPWSVSSPRGEKGRRRNSDGLKGEKRGGGGQKRKRKRECLVFHSKGGKEKGLEKAIWRDFFDLKEKREVG